MGYWVTEYHNKSLESWAPSTNNGSIKLSEIFCQKIVNNPASA
jgi:hypothetical protein